jgi:predicted P-loop ATPase
VTEELEYQEKFRSVLSWKPLTEAAKNDINNEAIREGIKVWPKDLERILVSEWTESYDPVREWLDSLPRWDGRDRLGELADRVKTLTPGWRENFKIWMRSMVSQWRAGRDALYGAQMVLMLVGGQGTRKSTFMRMLLPKELMPFYIDRIDFANKKEALRALSRFLLINIDEYDQISKAQTAFLKHLIQRTDVKERKLYSTTFEQQQRYAAFCATTNSLAPLKDESGSRRYMVVEVNGVIDTDTQGDKEIDYKQLYAQIVYEIESGEEYAFTGEREQQIIAQNSDYYEVPNVVSLFEDMFCQPTVGDQVLLKSPTEILGMIRDERKVNVVTQANATLIGSYLHRKGYRKGKGEKRRCYQIARKS